MEDWKQEQALSEFRDRNYQWKREEDKRIAELEEAMATALQQGNGSRFREIFEAYSKRVSSGYDVERLNIGDFPAAPIAPAQALRLFSNFYRMVRLRPEECLIHPLFPWVLLGLREGMSDLTLGVVCEDFLKTLLKVIVEPPLLRKVLNNAGQAKYGIPLEQLLQEYDWIRKRAKTVCKGRIGIKREQEIGKAFPQLKQALESGEFVLDLTKKELEPQWVAYSVLGVRYAAGASDLKREVTKARKIRTALNSVGLAYGQEVDLSFLDKLVELWQLEGLPQEVVKNLPKKPRRKWQRK